MAVAAVMTPPEETTRLEAELSLLEAMYPGSITYSHKGRELQYKATAVDEHGNGGDLTIRLPDTYPVSGSPILISARDASRIDIRDCARQMFQELSLAEGEEVLDQIIHSFEGLLADLRLSSRTAGDAARIEVPGTGASGQPGSKTVIIWLHHLLATSKRKLAVTPTLTGTATGKGGAVSVSSSLAGMTKPGYPGIMIFSGPSLLVDAHVRELKGLNWQAFQVRYDSSEEGLSAGAGADQWLFAHGTDKVLEVETMAALVKGIVRERDRDLFLRCVGVK